MTGRIARRLAYRPTEGYLPLPKQRRRIQDGAIESILEFHIHCRSIARRKQICIRNTSQETRRVPEPARRHYFDVSSRPLKDYSMEGSELQGAVRNGFLKPSGRTAKCAIQESPPVDISPMEDEDSTCGIIFKIPVRLRLSAYPMNTTRGNPRADTADYW